MEHARRPVDKARRQLGLLWGAVALSLIGLAPMARRAPALLPECPFRWLTGLPCPTCGTTRALLALLRFEPLEALTFNPLATLAAFGLVAGGLVAGAASIANRPLVAPAPAIGRSPTLRLSILAAALANWAYLVRAGI